MFNMRLFIAHEFERNMPILYILIMTNELRPFTHSLLPKNKKPNQKMIRLFCKKMFALASASLHIILSYGFDATIFFSSEVSNYNIKASNQRC